MNIRQGFHHSNTFSNSQIQETRPQKLSDFSNAYKVAGLGFESRS